MDTTTATLTETTARCEPLRPEWLRIADAIRVSSVGRSKLYQLIDEGKVRSVCLRERDKVRGIRLINAKSLSDYIASFEGNRKLRVNETAEKSARRAGEQDRA
jgi:hypothetical protein